MQIEQLWEQLEANSVAGKAGTKGWLLRLARPDADCPLFLGLELASGRRAILLHLPASSMPSRRLWPRSKGLESVAITIAAEPYFGVCLKESRYADVFTALIEDLVHRVTEAEGSSSQARVFLGQLARWQKFLSVSADGLSEEAQRGLWGELNLLQSTLLPALGAAAVHGWKGAEKAHQDFQFETGAIEVKTTLAKQPQVVRITSERQLDDSTLACLFLIVTALDTRAAGETLPDLVSAIREKLTNGSTEREQFEDELLEAGYLDSHSSRYADTGYVVRTIGFFRVKDGFPRLIEADLMPGTGDANYALNVSACEPFRVTATEMTATLSGSAPAARARRNRV